MTKLQTVFPFEIIFPQMVFRLVRPPPSLPLSPLRSRSTTKDTRTHEDVESLLIIKSSGSGADDGKGVERSTNLRWHSSSNKSANKIYVSLLYYAYFDSVMAARHEECPAKPTRKYRLYSHISLHVNEHVVNIICTSRDHARRSAGAHETNTLKLPAIVLKLRVFILPNVQMPSIYGCRRRQTMERARKDT